MVYNDKHFIWKLSLFELMLNIPDNIYGYHGMLPPFYGTFTQNEDVMTYNKCLLSEMGSITFESNELHYHYIAFSSLPLPLPLHTFWKSNHYHYHYFEIVIITITHYFCPDMNKVHFGRNKL